MPKASQLAPVFFLWCGICAPSLSWGQKLATHFFYWYDAPGNNVNMSLMPYDPPGIASPYNGTYYSSLSTAWYEWQLADMQTAGIDYAFPVSWGEKYQSNWFKQSVLSRMVTAIRNTNSPIKIGMYDDTNSEAAEWNADHGRGYTNSTVDSNLQPSLADASTPTYFYNQKIKPFFQMIPRDLWATHNGWPINNGGRPMLGMFTVYYYKDYDSVATMWQSVKSQFLTDFGVSLFLMPDWSWWFFGTDMLTIGDGEVIYGTACSAGTLSYTWNGYTVSNVGPGCDTRLLPARTDYWPRWSNGDATDDQLEDQWLRDNFHKIPTNVNLVLLESWNELWEGTAISRCANYPRQDGNGVLEPTYYMTKTAALMRELRDKTASPASLQNGTFEGSVTSGVGNSWKPWWLYGDITCASESTNVHAGTKAQRISTTSGTHDAGVYQRVAANAGTTYYLGGWTWRHDLFNNGSVNEQTFVGLDPAGGVDPAASSVIWSGGASSYHAWTQQQVSATATSNRVTVFVRCRANVAGSDMRGVFDDITLGTTPPGGTGTLTGSVRDQNSAGIVGATVSAAGGGSTMTTANGSYSLTLATGTYSVTASKTFYPGQNQSATISTGTSTLLDFSIVAPTPLPVGGFSATPGSGKATLQWSNPSSPFSGALIRYKLGSYPSSPTDGSLAVDDAGPAGAIRTYVHTGLQNAQLYYYTAFAYYQDASRTYGASAQTTVWPALRCDFDQDGDVDLLDFAHMQLCLSGPNIIATLPCVPADLSTPPDSDVDQDDVGVLIGCMSGADAYADPACGP